MDDAVSRAEFQKRKGLPALLNAVERRAVDVVVTRDESRLGGEMARTLLIQDILDSGAQLFYYASRERVQLDDASAKFMMAARNFASELAVVDSPSSASTPAVVYFYVSEAPSGSAVRTLADLDVLQGFNAGKYSMYTGPLPVGAERKDRRWARPLCPTRYEPAFSARSTDASPPVPESQTA